MNESPGVKAFNVHTHTHTPGCIKLLLRTLCANNTRSANYRQTHTSILVPRGYFTPNPAQTLNQQQPSVLKAQKVQGGVCDFMPICINPSPCVGTGYRSMQVKRPSSNLQLHNCLSSSHPHLCAPNSESWSNRLASIGCCAVAGSLLAKCCCKCWNQTWGWELAKR